MGTISWDNVRDNQEEREKTEDGIRKRRLVEWMTASGREISHREDLDAIITIRTPTIQNINIWRDTRNIVMWYVQYNLLWYLDYYIMLQSSPGINILPGAILQISIIKGVKYGGDSNRVESSGAIDSPLELSYVESGLWKLRRVEGLSRNRSESRQYRS